jgi:hypothetical protein
MRQMTVTALAGDRRIGMVAVLPAQIVSTHGSRATFLIGCAETIEDGDSCSTTYATSFYSAPSDLASGANDLRGATHLYRIAEAEQSTKRMAR